MPKRLTINEVKEYLLSKTEFELIDDEFIDVSTHINLSCSCKETCRLTLYYIKSRKIKVCANCRLKQEQNKKLIELKKFAEDNSEAKLLSDTYENSKTQKLKFECGCGELFYTPWQTFYYDNKRKCGICTGSNFRNTSYLKCSVCESNYKLHKINSDVYYCNRHYQQYRVNGKILKRTRIDDNDFYFHDNLECLVVSTYAQEEKTSEFLVDKEDWFRGLNEYKWTLQRPTKKAKAYVRGRLNGKGKNIAIHRLIMGAKDHEIVDHINGNTLDNRRCNLRIVNGNQSQMNRGLQSNNTSGYRGVCFNKASKKWQASIGYYGTSMHLGLYDDIEDAIKARQQAEDEYFGEYNRKE